MLTIQNQKQFQAIDCNLRSGSSLMCATKSSLRMEVVYLDGFLGRWEAENGFGGWMLCPQMGFLRK